MAEQPITTNQTGIFPVTRNQSLAPNPYYVTLYNGAWDPKPMSANVNGFQDLVDGLFKEHRYFGPPDALGKTPISNPAFSPAEFDGYGRKKENVVRVHFGVLDLDKIALTDFVEVIKKVEHLRAITYSTYSQGFAAQRSDFQQIGVSARVVFCFTRPVHTKEWEPFWRALNVWVGKSAIDGKDLLDKSTKNQDRLYFLPGTRSTQAPRFLKSWQGFQGQESLDVDKFIAFGKNLNHVHEPSEIELGKTELTKNDLLDLATTLKRRRSAALTEVAKAIDAIAEGKIYAGPTERDTMLFKICGHVARHFKSADPQQFANLFVRSLEVTNAAAGYGDVDEDVKKISEKFGRQQRQVVDEEEAQAAVEDAKRKRLMREAWESVGEEHRDTPYTIEELDAWRSDVGLTRKHVAGEEILGNRWILVRGKSHYVFVGGRYLRPIQTEDFLLSVGRDLAPAYPFEISLNEFTATGDLVPKQYSKIINDYGTLARQVVVNLNSQRTIYDAKDQTIYEAPCPLRPIEPKYHPEIDQWLRLLAGNTESQYKRLKMFTAFLSDLSRPCVVLYLDGVKDVGKSLYAKAAARLWTTQSPTTMDQAVSMFNDRIITCPLIFADEKMPRNFMDEGTAMIRQFQQDTGRDLQRKFLAAASMVGAIRLIMAANSKHMIDTKETLTEADMDAITDRILYLKASPLAGEHLQKSFTNPFDIVTQDLLAQHSLWLRYNSGLKPVGRFMVPLDQSALTMSLATTQGIRAQLCHWLISYLQNPRMYDVKGEHKILIRDKELWTNAGAISSCWDMYLNNQKNAPTLNSVSNGLRGMVKGDRKQARVNGVKNDYRVVNTEILISWAEETGASNREEIEEALARTTEIGTKRQHSNPFVRTDLPDWAKPQ